MEDTECLCFNDYGVDLLSKGLLKEVDSCPHATLFKCISECDDTYFLRYEGGNWDSDLSWEDWEDEKFDRCIWCHSSDSDGECAYCFSDYADASDEYDY